MSTWWGTRLAGAMQGLIDPGRLARGKALARGGQVLSMTVGPGRVRGQVQGSDPRPYTASFLLAALGPDDAVRVGDLLGSDPALVGRLIAGELAEVLGEDTYGLFPAYADELDFECSCPDWGWPCKHAAALVHVLLEGMDAQPRTLLELRGVDVAGLLGTAVAEPGSADADGSVHPDEAADEPRRWFEPRAGLPAPTPTFRAAMDDLDDELLRSALRPAGGDIATATAWLRDAYRRLG